MKTFYRITPTNHGWGYGYGFFSNYRICLEQIIHYENIYGPNIPYIDWSTTTWVEGFNPFESVNFKFTYNPFDLWFEQEIPNDEDVVVNCILGPRPDLIDHGKDYFNQKQELERQQSTDRKHIKIKNHIIKKIEDIYESEFKNHVVLGIMARGTEYNYHHPMYGIFNVHDYIRGVKKILDKDPEITKRFVVSEDSFYIDEIVKHFPSTFFIPNVFRRTDETDEYINKVHCWPNVSTKRKNHCELLGEETIIQTKLLSKCDYLFGRHSGVFCGAVLWNENIKKIFKI